MFIIIYFAMATIYLPVGLTNPHHPPSCTTVRV